MKYYTVEQLAERLHKPIDSIIDLGIDGKIKFLAIVDYEYSPNHIDSNGLQSINTIELRRIYHAKQRTELVRGGNAPIKFSTIDDYFFSGNFGEWANYFGDDIYRSRKLTEAYGNPKIFFNAGIGCLIIDTKEVERFENENGIEQTSTAIDIKPVEKIEPSINQKPWEIPDKRDPTPKQNWYIPARYFARQLVKDDSTLLTKRENLCQKIVISLDKVDIKKRGGRLSFNSNTIKKALTNVTLS